MEYILAVLEVFCSKTGMSFMEAVAWLEKNHTDENTLPWEEEK